MTLFASSNLHIDVHTTGTTASAPTGATAATRAVTCRKPARHRAERIAHDPGDPIDVPASHAGSRTVKTNLLERFLFRLRPGYVGRSATVLLNRSWATARRSPVASSLDLGSAVGGGGPREVHDVRHVVVPEPGATRARNAGARAADGEVIVFIDDDALPRSGWLPALLACFREPRTTRGRLRTKWCTSGGVSVQAASHPRDSHGSPQLRVSLNRGGLNGQGG